MAAGWRWLQGGDGCRVALAAGWRWLQGGAGCRVAMAAGWRWLQGGDGCRVAPRAIKTIDRRNLWVAMALLIPSPTNLKMKTKNILSIQQQFLYNRTTDFTKEPTDMIREFTVLAQSQSEFVRRTIEA